MMHKKSSLSFILLLAIISIISYLYFEDYISYFANRIQIKYMKNTNLHNTNFAFSFSLLDNINTSSDNNKNLSDNNKTLSGNNNTSSNNNNTLSESYKCNIFNKNAEQFNVTIDGVTYPKYIPLYHNNSYNFTCMNQDNTSKVILFWTKFFHFPTFNYGVGKSEIFAKNRCPVTNCEITNDKNRLNESDIIVFHMREGHFELPRTRSPNQRWLFLLYESPVNANDYSKYDGLFNLSATYKRSSDFSSLYLVEAFLKWGENKGYNINKNFLFNKTEFATAVIGNCNTKTNKRLEYLKELKQYIPLQVYGRCGDKQCPTTLENGTTADCKYILSLKYKFYLAFENTICEDYITEKLYNILQYDIIPVVYGGGPYDHHIPKSGYINALDYDSPKALAEYLLYVASNETAYNSYFKWKKYFYADFNDPHEGHFCEMCIRLNIDRHLGIRNSVISSFSSFWGLKKDCKMVNGISNISLVSFP